MNLRYKLLGEEEFIADLEKANKGNAEAAKAILDYFVKATEAGEQPDHRVIEYVANGIKSILNGEPKKKAFGLSNKLGRQPDIRNALRRYLVVQEFQRLHKETGLSYGLKGENAETMAAEYLKISGHTVQESVKRVRRRLKNQDLNEREFSRWVREQAAILFKENVSIMAFFYRKHWSPGK